MKKFELMLTSPQDAQDLRDVLRERVKSEGVVTVYDLNDLVGLPNTYIDTRFGWTEFEFIDVSITPNRVLMELPEPRKLQ